MRQPALVPQREIKEGQLYCRLEQQGGICPEIKGWQKKKKNYPSGAKLKQLFKNPPTVLWSYFIFYPHYFPQSSMFLKKGLSPSPFITARTYQWLVFCNTNIHKSSFFSSPTNFNLCTSEQKVPFYNFNLYLAPPSSAPEQPSTLLTFTKFTFIENALREFCRVMGCEYSTTGRLVLKHWGRVEFLFFIVLDLICLLFNSWCKSVTKSALPN